MLIVHLQSLWFYVENTKCNADTSKYTNEIKNKEKKKVNSMEYYVWSPFQEVNPPTGLNFSEKQEYMANMANFHI